MPHDGGGVTHDREKGTIESRGVLSAGLKSDTARKEAVSIGHRWVHYLSHRRGSRHLVE